MGLKEWVPGCALDVHFEVLWRVGAALSLPGHALGGTRGVQERADAFLNCGQCGGLSAPGCFSRCLPGPYWMPADGAKGVQGKRWASGCSTWGENHFPRSPISAFLKDKNFDRRGLS